LAVHFPLLYVLALSTDQVWLDLMLVILRSRAWRIALPERLLPVVLFPPSFLPDLRVFLLPQFLFSLRFFHLVSLFQKKDHELLSSTEEA